MDIHLLVTNPRALYKEAAQSTAFDIKRTHAKGNILHTLLRYSNLKKHFRDKEDGLPSDLKIFIDAGVDVNATDYYGDTPLLKICDTEWDNDIFHTSMVYTVKNEIIECLLKNGADPNIKNNRGLTPIQAIFQSAHELEINDGYLDEPIKMLIEAGAKFDINDLVQHTYEFATFGYDIIKCACAHNTSLEPIYDELVKESGYETELRRTLQVVIQNVFDILYAQYEPVISQMIAAYVW